MRGIDQKFIDDLRSGELEWFLKQVHEKRDVLSLEIREGFINIYYRGGSLLRIEQRTDGYSFSFNANYCLNKGDESAYPVLSTLKPDSANDYIENFSSMMDEMDSWFKAHPKNEREYQHILSMHNPSVIDIEYQINYTDNNGEAKGMSLDMIAVQDDKLIVIENKYGMGAIRGTAGLSKHYADICMILSDTGLYSELIQSMIKISNAKYQLGLTDKTLDFIDPDKKEILFLLADYNKRSKTVQLEIANMEYIFPAKLLIMDKTEYIIDYKKAEDLFTYGC